MRDSMTPKQHEQFFFDFIKNSGVFKFNYADKPIDGQKIIALMDVEKLETRNKTCQEMEDKGYAVIDPNWDQLYESFINIDFNRESVHYIKELVESSEPCDIVVELVIKKFIQSNIISDNVYVAVHPNWKTDWADEIVEV